MKESWKVGLSFGLTSGVITTLGLITGLYSGTNSKSVVISGILIIALADSLSDALGIHVAEESRRKKNLKQIWTATFSTFLFKLIFALSFAVPFIFLSMKPAIILGFFWGAFLLTFISFNLAKERKSSPYKAIFEHLSIAIAVIILTYLIGKGIKLLF
jgi:vacuolar iron transporter family protein